MPDYVAYLYVRRTSDHRILREVGVASIDPDYIDRVVEQLEDNLDNDEYSVDTSEAYALSEDGPKSLAQLEDDILLAMCKHEIIRVFGEDVAKMSKIFNHNGKWQCDVASKLEDGTIVPPRNGKLMSKKAFIRRILALREQKQAE